ncbi:MAG: hypothetical protein EAZ89_06765 [Bacteroidetes bacterium]|nr:MAG: hypothetical protein EAZ89_06765 [Bacteroidota bacterium]
MDVKEYKVLVPIKSGHIAPSSKVKRVNEFFDDAYLEESFEQLQQLSNIFSVNIYGLNIPILIHRLLQNPSSVIDKIITHSQHEIRYLFSKTIVEFKPAIKLEMIFQAYLAEVRKNSNQTHGTNVDEHEIVFLVKFGFAFEEALKKIFFVIDLACPGAFEYECLLKVLDDNNYFGESDGLGSLSYQGASHCIEKGWPTIHKLEAKKVWEWIRETPLILDTPANNSIERALNAYSHTFYSQYRERKNGLTWAMVAVEALYNQDGNNDVQRKIRENAEALLGNIEWLKKMIDNMYNVRSKLFHGGLPVNSIFALPTKQKNTNLEESMSLAVGLLIGTFQKLIIDNMHSLEFERTVTVKQPK